MRSRIVAGVAVLACVGSLAACSSSGSSSKAAGASVTLEQALDWYGRAVELALPCQSGARAVDTALTTAANDADAGDSDLPTVLAAGQAIEDCEIEADSVVEQREWASLASVLPAETAKLREWIGATVTVDENALLVAAGNFDSRRFVTALFDSQRVADAIADELEEMIAERAASLGVESPKRPILHRWDAPGH